MPSHRAELLEARRLLAALPVGVENAPPAVALNVERYVAFGRGFRVLGAVTDADGDRWIATADFGDNSPVFSNSKSVGGSSSFA